MTEQEVKALVRKRDGYRCARCGMTEEQHQSEYGRSLDVHRVLPGIGYVEHWSLTVCRPCHGKLPKKLIDVVVAETREECDSVGVAPFFLLHHHADDRWVFNVLCDLAERHKTRWELVALHLLKEACQRYVPDYVI